jgi:hypothetical protein
MQSLLTPQHPPEYVSGREHSPNVFMLYGPETLLAGRAMRVTSCAVTLGVLRLRMARLMPGVDCERHHKSKQGRW